MATRPGGRSLWQSFYWIAEGSWPFPPALPFCLPASLHTSIHPSDSSQLWAVLTLHCLFSPFPFLSFFFFIMFLFTLTMCEIYHRTMVNISSYLLFRLTLWSRSSNYMCFKRREVWGKPVPCPRLHKEEWQKLLNPKYLTEVCAKHTTLLRTSGSILGFSALLGVTVRGNMPPVSDLNPLLAADAVRLKIMEPLWKMQSKKRQNAISTERQTLVYVLICSNKYMHTSNYSTVMKFNNRNQHFWVSRSTVTDTKGRTALSKSQAEEINRWMR